MPTTITQTPVIVLVERECFGSHDPALRRIARAADAKRVHLVVPAGPVAGEHWLIDVAARERTAQERLESWTAALNALAIAVDGEIGDANPRLAFADALRGLGRGGSLLTLADATSSPTLPAGRPERLARRMPTRVLAA